MTFFSHFNIKTFFKNYYRFYFFYLVEVRLNALLISFKCFKLEKNSLQNILHLTWKVEIYQELQLLVICQLALTETFLLSIERGLSYNLRCTSLDVLS